MEPVKKCTHCGIVKPHSQYYKRPSRPIGIRPLCKICADKKHLNYVRSVKGLVSKTYSRQKMSSKKRGHSLPDYTKEELMDWCLNQNEFMLLYDNWKNSEYKKELIPSVNRINNEISYTLSNLEIMSWKEHNDMSYEDKKKGLIDIKQRPVMGTHIHTGEVVNFHSISQAARSLELGDSNISHCCMGKHKHIGGYKWNYI